MTLLEEKNALRSAMRQMRRQIPPEDRAAWDAALLRQVTASPWFQQADTLLCYVACGGEAGTAGLLEAALAAGKTVAVPKCGKQGKMTFHCIRSLAELQPGAYGILEPEGGAEPSLTKNTLCLVPATAYTPTGKRLGQGGGYYDRLMAEHPEVTYVGLCYHCQLQNDVPCEAHDRRVFAVITERSMEVCDGIQSRK